MTYSKILFRGTNTFSFVKLSIYISITLKVEFELWTFHLILYKYNIFMEDLLKCINYKKNRIKYILYIVQKCRYCIILYAISQPPE